MACTFLEIGRSPESAAHRWTLKSGLHMYELAWFLRSTACPFPKRHLGATSRLHGQRTIAALRKALRFHAEGMIKSGSVVFSGKGCRQLD